MKWAAAIALGVLSAGAVSAQAGIWHLDPTASASFEAEGAPASLINDGDDGTAWYQNWDQQPRPPWIRLDWDRPQTFNEIMLRAESGTYASQDVSIEASEDGRRFRELVRVQRLGQQEWIRTERFEPTTARALRLTFHKGGVWADRNTVQTLSVRYRPD